MDNSGAGFKIEKLGESNYHVWKQKVELVLAFREHDNHIDVDSNVSTKESKKPSWLKADAKAKAIIGLTLSDEHLEHVRECETAAEMWNAIADLFRRRTLLNRLASRGKFYAAKMEPNERVINYVSRVWQLAADLKAMDTVVEDQEIAMTVLCGLPSRFEHLVVAINAVANDDNLTLDFVKSRLLQEEQRIIERSPNLTSAHSALVNTALLRVRTTCSHCKRRCHTGSRCWQKYPHLRPPSNSKGMVVGFHLSNTEARSESLDSHNDDYICLVGNHGDISLQKQSSTPI